ncbi:MAG TPA: AAA family ATPase [Solirubrobacterales bacterium]
MDPAARIVGRDREIERLDRVLATVEAERRGRIVEVVGEPGIGKSRLVAELSERAEERGFLVLGGMAAEFERELPFGLVLDALDGYLEAAQDREVERLAGNVTGELATIFPSLREYATAEAPGLQTERHRSHHAVRILFEGLASTRPMLIALDDVHWADEASLELLASLIRRPPAAGVLLALAFRGGQEPAILASARRVAEQGGWHDRLELGPLSSAEAGELVGDELDPRRGRALIAEAGGNPFYLTELLRMSLRGPGGPERAEGHATPDDAEVPAGIAAALDGEIAALSDPARDFLRAASVTGEPFDLGLAAEVAGIAESDALALVDELLAEEMIRPTDVPRRFRFRHPLVRSAIYRSSPAGGRIAAHAKAAAALTARGAGPTERAHHLERSAAPGDLAAVDVLEEAALLAAPRAPATAARWLGAALRLVPETAPGAEERRLALLVPLATSLGAIGRFRESIDVVGDALAALPADAGVVRMRLIAARAGMKDLLGDHAAAKEDLEGHYAETDAGSAERAAVEIEFAVNAFWTTDYDEMRSWGERALATAEPLGDRVLHGTAAAILAYAETLLGRIEAAERHRAAAAAELDGASEEELALRLEGLSHLGWAEYFLGRLEPALAHMERGIGISRETGQEQFLPPLRLGRSATLATLGRLGEAREASETVADAARLAEIPQALCQARTFTCWWAALQGDLEEAQRAGEEAVAVAERIGVSTLSVVAGVAYAECRVMSGDPAGGVEILHRWCGGPALDLVPRNWQPLALEVLARAELRAGRPVAAEAAAAAAEEAAESLGLGIPRAHAGRARAAVLLAAGDADAAAERALAAADLLAAIGALEEEGRSRLLAGRALAEAGDRERAVAELREAERILDGCGSARLRDWAAKGLRRLGERTRRARPAGDGEATGLPSLTAREREVAELVTDRRTNREIAAELVLSEKTIESHLRNVFAKLGVGSRVEVARAVEGARAEKFRG